MPSLTIYFGSARGPIRATGKNCVRLLSFAERNRGWHTFKNDRATRNAIASLVRRECLEVSGDQFRFVYPGPGLQVPPINPNK